MGLTSWEKTPTGKILKTDVSIAKNYLSKEEIEALGRIVNPESVTSMRIIGDNRLV